MSGKYFHCVPYGVNDDGFIDYDEVESIAKCKPKMIIAGASAYARKIDFKRFREIADSVGAYLMVDMAHIAGLVAAVFTRVNSICSCYHDDNPQNITWTSWWNDSFQRRI